MSIAEDGYLGAIIGLILATKRLLENSPVNAECIVVNFVLLYVILGWKIGFHWLKFVGLTFVTVFAYFLCLRPAEVINSVTDLSELGGRVVETLDFGKEVFNDGIRTSTMFLNKVLT